MNQPNDADPAIGTSMLSLIQMRDFAAAEERCLTHPQECSQGIVLPPLNNNNDDDEHADNNNNLNDDDISPSPSVYPLHLAIQSRAPSFLIRAILNAYPPAAHEEMKDDFLGGHTLPPLHAACCAYGSQAATDFERQELVEIIRAFAHADITTTSLREMRSGFTALHIVIMMTDDCPPDAVRELVMSNPHLVRMAPHDGREGEMPLVTLWYHTLPCVRMIVKEAAVAAAQQDQDQHQEQQQFILTERERNFCEKVRHILAGEALLRGEFVIVGEEEEKEGEAASLAEPLLIHTALSCSEFIPPKMLLTIVVSPEITTANQARLFNPRGYLPIHMAAAGLENYFPPNNRSGFHIFAEDQPPNYVSDSSIGSDDDEVGTDEDTDDDDDDVDVDVDGIDDSDADSENMSDDEENDDMDIIDDNNGLPAEVNHHVSNNNDHNNDNNNNNATPLSSLSSTPHFTHDIITKLLQMYPAGAKCQGKNGALPLNLALASGKKWHEGVETLLRAAPQALYTRDLYFGGMYPIMIAAGMACDYCCYRISHEEEKESSVQQKEKVTATTADLETIYHLILEDPVFVSNLALTSPYFFSRE